jgi:predicted kinase/transposase
VDEENKKKSLAAARRYFDLAYRYAGGKPFLVVVFGLSGTGKSTLARALSERLLASYYNSDIVRKSLLNIPPEEHRYEPFGHGIYSPEMTQKTYETLAECAKKDLQQGRDVVLDATYQKRAFRELVLEKTAGLPVKRLFVWCKAPEETIKERLEKRKVRPQEPSDGRWEIFLEQKKRFEPPEEIEKLARHFASLIRKKKLEARTEEEKHEPHWEEIDVNSVKNEDVRTVGAESVGAWAYKELGITEVLQEVGFNKKEIDRAKVMIIGKLVNPGSEKEIYEWFSTRSGLDEVMDIDSKRISLSSLYRTSDKLVANKEKIEEKLVARERELFGLGERLILYDLTNSYFEGMVSGSELSKRGISKEKRHDRPLVTVGIILDEDGFPKSSRVFPGNVSEPSTLERVLDDFFINSPRQLSLDGRRPTVVMDAGIATEGNLELIRKKGLDYICVDRRRVKEIPSGKEKVVHEGDCGIVKAIRVEEPSEIFLNCTSSGRARKEEGIKNRFQLRLEEDLEKIRAGLKRRGGIKSYPKVLERIGRLKEKYSSVSQFYEIKVKEENGKATEISWRLKDESRLQVRFSGTYKLRSSRTDLTDEELWGIYNLLSSVEASFRSLKHELSLRPIYHRIDKRITGHIFITVLAYHLLCVIRRKLKEKGITCLWETIRKNLSSLVRVTTTLVTRQGKTIHLRQTSEPEPFHLEVYNALELPLRSLQRIVKIS